MVVGKTSRCAPHILETFPTNLFSSQNSISYLKYKIYCVRINIVTEADVAEWQTQQTQNLPHVSV